MRKNRRNGSFYQYHRNGRIQRSGQYLSGKRHGIVYYYGYNGKLKSKTEYRYGRYIRRIPVSNNRRDYRRTKNYRKGTPVYKKGTPSYRKKPAYRASGR